MESLTDMLVSFTRDNADTITLYFRATDDSLGGDLLERETDDEPGDPDPGDELWMVLCVDAIKGLSQALIVDRSFTANQKTHRLGVNAEGTQNRGDDHGVEHEGDGFSDEPAEVTVVDGLFVALCGEFGTVVLWRSTMSGVGYVSMDNRSATTTMAVLDSAETHPRAKKKVLDGLRDEEKVQNSAHVMFKRSPRPQRLPETLHVDKGKSVVEAVVWSLRRAALLLRRLLRLPGPRPRRGQGRRGVRCHRRHHGHPPGNQGQPGLAVFVMVVVEPAVVPAGRSRRARGRLRAGGGRCRARCCCACGRRRRRSGRGGARGVSVRATHRAGGGGRGGRRRASGGACV